eukprot:m.177608 g.177608  ORF g.177608 m.177608 type:complete len:292 (+) comp16822_c0_seq9:3570-4445(+)
MHYDNHHNVYVMISGRKTFHLLSAEWHTKLGLRSALHPAHRSTRINLDTLQELSPEVQVQLQAAVTSVTLSVGDVLVVPAMTLHHVVNHELSLSVNWWSTCALTQQTQAVIALLPLGLSDLSDLPAVVRVQLVRTFVELLFAQLTALLYPVSQQTKRELLVTFVSTVIQPRLTELASADDIAIEDALHETCCDDMETPDNSNTGVPESFTPPTSRFCSCPCAFESLLQEHPFHARNLQQALDALQTMMAQWNSLGTAAMIKTAVANVFEWLVHFGLGAEFSQPFWQDVVAC